MNSASTDNKVGNTTLEAEEIIFAESQKRNSPKI